MDRRRPALGHSIPRPSSAPRRGYDLAWGTKGPHERLAKQSSVPNMVQERKRAAYDPRAALRRSASAASLASREERRRPERAWPVEDRWGFQKAEALQLESRLTQRLREHSFSSIEPTRRPRRKSQVLAPERQVLPDRRKTPSPYRSSWEGLGYGASSFYAFGTPHKRPVSTTSSPYQPSYQSYQSGEESQLKIYSDLFEEVIERDRVFGPLLRKVKSAYDSMLSQAPTPARGQSLRASRSSEPTIREEPMELFQENQALKDLIERLHMELEEAVKREQRWKSKASKLKARYGAPQASQELYELPHGAQSYDWAHSEEMRRQTFQANRREPGYEAQEVLNQGGLMSLSSISPQHSQLVAATSARSDDSGILPQRPERRVLRPASVPKLDLTKMQELLEEEYEEDELEGPEEAYEEGIHDESDDGCRAPSEIAA